MVLDPNAELYLDHNIINQIPVLILNKTCPEACQGNK